jgi:hypothetical protein
MATLSQAARNAAVDAVAAFCETGTTAVAPYIRFFDAGAVTLSRKTLASSSPGVWNSASSDVASLAVAPFAMQLVTEFGGGVETSGTIATAQLNTRGGTVAATLTVTITGGGGDIELDSLEFAAGQGMVANSFDLVFA